jgi:hypothetical protein
MNSLHVVFWLRFGAMCKLHRGQPPRGAYPQQLVQAWKELDRRRKLAK